MFSPTFVSSGCSAKGLDSTVFIDASRVAMVLVPAIMDLLGEPNWWFPT